MTLSEYIRLLHEYRAKRAFEDEGLTYQEIAARENAALREAGKRLGLKSQLSPRPE